MLEETISTIINTTINSFDFGFCISTNIFTYLIIKFITDSKRKKIPTWRKRLIFIICSLITSIVYWISGSEIKIIFNSLILAPVSWSWIFKPICDKFKIGYNNFAKK